MLGKAARAALRYLARNAGDWTRMNARTDGKMLARSGISAFAAVWSGRGPTVSIAGRWTGQAAAGAVSGQSDGGGTASEV